MSEADDDSSKTEEASERKLGEARGKGQVWNSREVGHWSMFLAIAMVLGMLGPGIAQGITRAILPFLEKTEQIPVDAGGLGGVLIETVLTAAKPLLFPLLILLIAIIVPHIAQTGFLFATESIKPQLSKLSPLQGLKRIFSINAS